MPATVSMRFADDPESCIVCPLCEHETRGSNTEAVAVSGDTEIRVCTDCVRLLRKLEDIRARLLGRPGLA